MRPKDCINRSITARARMIQRDSTMDEDGMREEDAVCSAEAYHEGMLRAAISFRCTVVMIDVV